MPRRAPPLYRTPVRSLPEGLSLTAPERKGEGKVSSLRETSNQDTDDSQSEKRNKLNPYKLSYGELSEEEELEDFEYLELTEGDEDIILHPKTSKNKVGETSESSVQSLDPKDNQKGNQNSWNRQETGDPEEIERNREINSELESEQGSEPRSNEHLLAVESIPSLESDNDEEMAQPNPNPPSPPVVERGPSIRLPWFTGKEDEQVEKYFRELKILKAIYKWQDDHLLNMSLFGLRGRADDWASALDDADKATFAKLEEAMTKIFEDKRAQWQKHADISNLKQLKEQSGDVETKAG